MNICHNRFATSPFVLPFLACAYGFSGLLHGGDLAEVQTLTRDDLGSVTSVTISNDGRFLYAAAFNPGNVLTFKRNPESGIIEYQDIVTGEALSAAVAVNLSADGKYLLASSFAANRVTLFRRDDSSGALTVLGGPFDEGGKVGALNFVIDAGFSPDTRFVYTASSGGVGVFALINDQLSFIQYDQGGGNLKGVRDATLSPDGKWLYAPGYQSGTLGVYKRDGMSGKIELVQMLQNGDDGTRGIAGAFRVAASSDGKHVYLSSGRFNGDQAVSAYEVQADGKLKQIQVFENGENDFKDFSGGNTLILSKDEKSLYVLATLSDRLFRFSRDPATGKLTFGGSQLVGPEALPGSAGLCFSPDGKFLYIADEASHSIIVLRP